MPKFMEIDLLENLEKIMKQNTRSYQSDFEKDKEILIQAAVNADTVTSRERTYLWMSRTCGTWCFKEWEVFIKPAAAHLIWKYYSAEMQSRILAYAVEVTGMDGRKVLGNLYPLDYQRHVELVNKVSLPAEQVKLTYEKGECYQNCDKRIPGEDGELGKLLYFEYQPNDNGALEAVLCQEADKRKRMRCGKIENHIQQLAA